MYIDENLVNQEGTYRFERKRKVREGLENFLESKLSNEESIKEAYTNKECVLKEELNLAIGERFAKDEEVESLNEAVANLNESTEELFLDILSETVIRSLNIDEKLIESNREAIVDKVKGFYRLTEDSINLEGSQVVVDLVKKCEQCSKTFDIERHDALYEEADRIALIIKEKVCKVIKEEKEMSSLEIMKEEDQYSCSVDIRLTLFKEMEIENVKEVLRESADRNLDKQTIMLMSFYETVVEYTLLETFNTLRMIEFNNEMYNDSTRRRNRDFEIKDI